MTKKKSYEILGLDKTSSEEEIKKTYYGLAKKYHPDRNKSKDAGEVFKKINEAYEVLVHPTGIKGEVVICSHCGRPVDITVETKKAEEPEPVKPPPAKISLALPIIVVVQVICLLVLAYLYFNLLTTRNELKLTDLQKENSLLQSSINGYKKQSDTLTAMISFMNDGDAGRSSGSFFASDKIIVLSKSDKNKTINITAKFEQPYTVEWDYNSALIEITKDSEWENKMLTLYVTPLNKGYGYVTFSNNKNLQRFRVMVIVTD